MTSEQARANAEKYIEMVRECVGNTYDLEYQVFRKEKAGRFEILSFEEIEPTVKPNSYFETRGKDVADSIHLGFFKIRFLGTKFYDNKEFFFPVEVYFAGEEETERIFVNNARRDTNKRIKAYEFGFLN